MYGTGLYLEQDFAGDFSGDSVAFRKFLTRDSHVQLFKVCALADTTHSE